VTSVLGVGLAFIEFVVTSGKTLSPISATENQTLVLGRWSWDIYKRYGRLNLQQQAGLLVPSRCATGSRGVGSV